MELQTELIELYFTWANPWFPVVDEILFKESLYSGHKYCSPLLLLCIFGLGSRFSDRLEVRSDPADSSTAGKFFLERAETLLHFEIKSPKITTIQSLSIMSILYCVGDGARYSVQEDRLYELRLTDAMRLVGCMKVWRVD